MTRQVQKLQMIIEHKKTWGYKCPHCTGDVVEEMGLFDITSYQPLESSCPICKTRLGTISKDKNGGYIIEVPCYVCQEAHVFRVPQKLFWNRPLFSLGCTLSGYDICYFGENSEVEESLMLLNDEILKRYEMTDEILDECDDRIRQALDILQEIASGGNLFCLCGKNKLQVGLEGTRITIRCSTCGAFEIIKMETDEDLERLQNRKSIVLVKK